MFLTPRFPKYHLDFKQYHKLAALTPNIKREDLWDRRHSRRRHPGLLGPRGPRPDLGPDPGPEQSHLFGPARPGGLPAGPEGCDNVLKSQ